MASAGNALKMKEEAGIRGKILFAGIILAIIVSFTASAWMHIYAGSHTGALNISDTVSGSFFNGSMANVVANFIIPKVSTPLTRDIIISRYLFTAIGAFSMAILMFLHSRFLWWPIHYIGFPIADAHPLLYYWFSIFLAWLVKGMILKFGGHGIYKKSVPFFLGLILGNVLWLFMQGALNLVFDKTIIVVS